MPTNFRRHKNGKAYPITPKTTFTTRGLTQDQVLSLVDTRQADLASKHILEMFHKGEAGYLDYRPTPQGREYYRPKISDNERLKLKRALVSAANKARAQGHPEVAEVYEKAYKQMILPSKKEVRIHNLSKSTDFNTVHDHIKAYLAEQGYTYQKQGNLDGHRTEYGIITDTKGKRYYVRAARKLGGTEDDVIIVRSNQTVDRNPNPNSIKILINGQVTKGKEMATIKIPHSISTEAKKAAIAHRLAKKEITLAEAQRLNEIVEKE